MSSDSEEVIEALEEKYKIQFSAPEVTTDIIKWTCTLMRGPFLLF